MQERLKKITKRVSIWISVLVVCFSLSFCSPRVLTQYVDVPRIEKEYINHTDSVYVHDSIYVEKTTKKDTVYQTKYKTKTIFKYQRDTVSRTDTLTVIKEVPVPKPYVPKYYHKVNAGFWVLLAIVVVLAGFKIYKIIKRIKKV